MTTITAIVPTYNRAATLGQALASIFAQTRVPDEVLVVDDGSTDETAAVVGRFPGATLLRLGRNGGAAAARNAGIRAARGELLAFLDSDDAWLPHKLERQLPCFDDPGLDLLCTGIAVQERDGRRRNHVAARAPSAGAWSFADFQAYPFCPTTWLVRRSLFAQEGAFDETLGNAEDLDFLARVSHRRIDAVPEPLALKFNRQDSLDASLERTAASYAILFTRYHGLWTRAPAAATRSCRRLAHMHLDAGQPARARAALRAGLRYTPWDLRSWGLLAASALGGRALAAMRQLARRLA